MLSGIQLRAITRCLIDLNDHLLNTHGEPGESLLAVLQETPVTGHPDPTARHIGVNPVPVPPRIWRDPHGPVAALRAAHDDMRRSNVQGQLSRVTGTRFLAWVYSYTVTVDNPGGPVTLRQIDAVDIDGHAYALTQTVATAGHTLQVVSAATLEPEGTHAILSTLAQTMRTNG
ncbi:hypothetical protein ACQP2X_39550 [Actinoplanes sp. CA-131856]